MAGFILRGLIAALGLWAATELLSGFTDRLRRRR